MVKQYVEEGARNLASSKGWTLEFIKKAGNHKDDEILALVICKRESDYCTHLYNHEIGFVYGHYDFKTFEEAMTDLQSRG